MIVGEGIALRKNSGLSETLFALAASGRSVLWFGPEEGEFSIPGVGDDSKQNRPDNLLLTGSDMIVNLDERLDAYAWDAENTQTIGLQLVAERGRTLVKFVKPTAGWTWMRADFTDTNGKLILCGLRLAKIWEASPTPRYMLARLLELIDNIELPAEPRAELDTEK